MFHGQNFLTSDFFVFFVYVLDFQTLWIEHHLPEKMSFMKKLTKGAQKVMGTVGDSVDKGQFSFPLPLRTHDN